MRKLSAQKNWQASGNNARRIIEGQVVNALHCDHKNMLCVAKIVIALRLTLYTACIQKRRNKSRGNLTTFLSNTTHIHQTSCSMCFFRTKSLAVLAQQKKFMHSKCMNCHCMNIFLRGSKFIFFTIKCVLHNLDTKKE